jgi:outer membrane protein assembly factor BamB
MKIRVFKATASNNQVGTGKVSVGILAILLILIAVSLSGCAQKKPEVETTPTAPVTPTPATPITPTPAQPRLSLEKIEPAKEREKIPENYLPALLPWKLFKGGAESSMFYPSFIPRKPEVVFRVNVSSHFGFFVSTPLIEGDKIYLADDAGIYALDRKTGEFLWGKEILSDSLEGRKISYPQPWERWEALGIGKSVAAYGLGRYLYVATSGGGKNLVIAFDKATGNVVWKSELEGEEDNLVTSNLLVADGKVCAGTVHSDARVYCFTEDGKFLWSTKLEGNIRGLAYGDGTIFVTSEPTRKLFALDASSGEVKWVYQHDSGVNTAAYVEGRIIFTDSSGRVAALSKDGQLLWKKNVGAGSDVNTNSLLAASRNGIYVARTLGEEPLELYVLDLDGNTIGSFTLLDGEYPGIPLVTEDIVVLPVKKNFEYSKIYLLWRGTAKLYELKVLESDEPWMPRVAVAYGEIYAVGRIPDVIYRLVDEEKPVIKEVRAELLNASMRVKAVLQDERSAIYRAILVYSINGSDWKYEEMQPSRRYVTEPIGGYGLSEEPYEATIQLKPGSRIEFYVVAIDNVGNYAMSEGYAYRVVYGQ